MYKKILAIMLIIICLLTVIVSADTGDEDFWKLLKGFRRGLFWVGMFVSFYGLYLQMLKRDDLGKKIVIVSILTYLASYVVPTIFIAIDKTFGK